jgi:hypothetical protein
MKSRRSKAFRKMFEALPETVQRQANTAYKRFKENPTHPGLNLEQVGAKGPVFSIRVGIHYRALAIRRPDHWLWFWIGPHDDYDKLLADLQ